MKNENLNALNILTNNYNFFKNNNLKIINLSNANIVLTPNQTNISAFILCKEEPMNASNNLNFDKNCIYLIYDESKSKNLNTTHPLYYGIIRNSYQFAKKEITFDDFKEISLLKYRTDNEPSKYINFYTWTINNFESNFILNLSLKYNNRIYYLNNLAKDGIFLGLNNSLYYLEEKRGFNGYILNNKNDAFVSKKEDKINNYLKDADKISQLKYISQTYASDSVSFGDLSQDFYSYLEDIAVLKDYPIIKDFVLGFIYAIYKNIIEKNPRNFQTEADKRLLVSNLAHNLKQRLEEKQEKKIKR